MDEWVALLREIEAKVNDLDRRLERADSVIRQDLAVIKSDIERLHRMQPEYVTQREYDPVRRIVFGMVSLVLVAVAGAVIALVVRG